MSFRAHVWIDLCRRSHFFVLNFFLSRFDSSLLGAAVAASLFWYSLSLSPLLCCTGRRESWRRRRSHYKLSDYTLLTSLSGACILINTVLGCLLSLSLSLTNASSSSFSYFQIDLSLLSFFNINTNNLKINNLRSVSSLHTILFHDELPIKQ